ncbi:MAG: hypothetical protein ACO1RT_04005 [Planctomycetaceae bacterium]
MAAALHSAPRREQVAVRVRPSRIDPPNATPFTLDQELKPFGKWVDAPIWVPPKDSSKEMAESMLKQSGLLTSKSKSWASVVKKHREHFTQVREIELAKASIRLPKGRLFVSVTEQPHFDRITDTIPACVQTRLDEFLAGPGRQTGVKVYYLKPLCVEVGDELHFTSKADVLAAIDKIQQEVFSEYRRLYFSRLAKKSAIGVVNAALAVPRGMARHVLQRRQRDIDAHEARFEFRRRTIALDAAKTYRTCRSDGCTFEEMLELTNPLQRDDVVRHYSDELKLSRAKKAQLLRIAAGQLPWFAGLSTLSIGGAYLTYLASVASVALTFSPPLLVCDPAFVAELPGSGGVVLNIGHFDEIAGVRHVEL